MSGVPRFATGVLALLAGLAFPVARADEAADLRAENARLRALVRQHASGMFFDEVKSKSGTSYHDAVIKEVTDSAVRFHYSGGDAELAAADCPQLWAELFGYPVQASSSGEGKTPATTKATSASTPTAAAKESTTETPRASATSTPAAAIAVVEGDQGSGTGFFCRAENDKIYFYTAAHVISGNSKLQVKLRNGSVVRKFGELEAAEGGDLVRLPVNEPIADFLEIAPEAGLAKVGEDVLASGNAAGAGTVGFEKGKVLGVGPTSIEIDAQVIQGNSGGPILDSSSSHALGVVTHLTAARDDRWAKDTRFSGVRRFGCRLDRHWDWKKVSIEAFLKEGKAVAAVQEMSELMIAALDSRQWKGEVFRRLATNQLARDITALDLWIDEQKKGGQRASEADRKRRLRSVLDSARLRSKTQISTLNSQSFTWFHRDLAEQEARKREEIDKVYESSLLELR